MNIDELLKPISESAPCGEDLSFSSEFDEISEMRREDDPTLDQGAWVTALKTADWPGARDRCAQLLSTRSKDLRLAMWWTEASTLVDGYAGLHQGIVLCGRLCERYWDGMFPQADGGDTEERVGNIGWFLGRLNFLSNAAPLTQARSGAYSLLQLQMAKSHQTAIERNPERAAQLPADALTLDKFNRALRETPKETLRNRVAQIEGCLQALAAWQAISDSRLGDDGPSFVSAREALATALHEVQRLGREVGAVSGAPAPAPAEASPAGASAPRAAGGPLRTREQALAQLREVATFFRATEPHSPVAYLADKAVQWGDMPLHEWLRTVVKDAGSLAHIEELLGLAQRPESSP